MRQIDRHTRRTHRVCPCPNHLRLHPRATHRRRRSSTPPRTSWRRTARGSKRWFAKSAAPTRGSRFFFPKNKNKTPTTREKNSRYYAWRLRTSRLELARNAGDAAAWAARTRTRAIADIAARRRPLDADDRARALGETPLKRRAFFEKPPPGAAASEAAFGVDAAAGSFNTAGDRTRIASALSGAFTPGAVEGGGDVRGDIGETETPGPPGVARGAHRRRLSARAARRRAGKGGGASGGGARRRRRARGGGADGRREDVARLGAGGVAVQALRRPGPVRARGRARASRRGAAGDGSRFSKIGARGERARGDAVKKNERTKGTKGKKKRLFWGLLTAPLLTNAKTLRRRRR